MKSKISFLIATLAIGSFSTFLISQNEEKHIYNFVDQGKKNVRLEENTDTALEIALEGTVLLKNDFDVLPLKKTDTIALVNYGNVVFGGGGSGAVNSNSKIDYRAGLRNAKNEGYLEGVETSNVNQIVEDANKVIYFIQRTTSEGSDNTVDGYFNLSDKEKSDITTLINNYGKENLIVVLNVGSVINTTWLIEQDVGAIVCSYYGGDQAGTSLAMLLTGQRNFSGKTVDTWAKSYEDYSSSKNFGDDRYTIYEEDIYVGYRYFDTFDPNYEKVNYEFGFGLSYTDFEYEVLNAEVNDGYFDAEVKVTNTGDMEGKEVLELYYSAPMGQLGKPAHELGAFLKTPTIPAKGSTTVNFHYLIDDMKSFDDLGVIQKNSWVLEKGDYKFYLGDSIKDAGDREAIYTYTLEDDRVLETSNANIDSTKLKDKLVNDGSGEEKYIQYNDEDAANKVNYIVNGTTYVQAEDFVNKSSPSPTSELFYVGVKEGRGVGNLNTADKWVEYKIDVKDPGTYTLAFNMSSAWDGQNDMFNLLLDGVDQQHIQVSMNKTHTDSDGLWYTNTRLSNNAWTLDLSEGEHTIRLVANGTNFQNIDHFTLYKNTISQDKVTTIGGEVTSGGDVNFKVVPDSNATEDINEANRTLIYSIDVEQTGDYYLKLNASNLLKASDDIASLYLNNNLVSDAKFSLMRSASGGTSTTLVSNSFNFIDTNSVKLHLEAGKNEIKLVTKNEALTSLNSLIFTPSAIYENEDYTYEDNTSEFVSNTDFDGEVLDKLITYQDVYVDNSLMDDFLSQLSIQDLSRLLGIDAGSDTSFTGTGAFGGKYVDSKFGIPFANTADGPQGIRYSAANTFSTYFPSMTMLASTWNLDLAYDFGMAVGAEAKSANVQLWLAPGMNIHRNPLGGRNFEYYSEDPLITGKFASQVTRGCQTLGVSVCIKHYAVNSQETNRFYNESITSSRALREIYLKGFEIVIKEANPHGIMTSYNRCNGNYVSANENFVNKLIREEWGFNGVIVTDWGATANHPSLVLSGNDVRSNNPDYNSLIQAYTSRVISREDLERAAKNVINFLLMSNIISANYKQYIHTISNHEVPYIDETAINLTEYTVNRDDKYYFNVMVSDDDSYTLTFPTKVNAINIDGNDYALDENGSVTIALKEGQHKLIITSDTNFGAGDICEVSFKEATTPEEPDDPNEPITPDDPSEDTPTQKTPKDNTGIIVGSVVGGVVVVALIGTGLYFFLKKKKSNVK